MTNLTANILIVDDQPDNLRTLSAILNHQGYRVRKAVSGSMALKTVLSDPPNLILLDIRMPDMNGYEVCAALKSSQTTQQIPIIFLSALSETVDKVKAFSVGGSDYITKPFQAEEVLARIRQQLLIQEQQQRLEQEIAERCKAETAVRQLNHRLEELVQQRTAQLQQSLECEELLKRITDRVRDSLDEEKILRAVVQELATGLRIECCTTEIYGNLPTDPSTIYEYDRCPFSFIYNVDPANSLSLYQQLLQKQEMQFCVWNSSAISNQQQTVLVCPIFDDYGLLGNLRLFRASDAVFNDLETRLIRQVANQCAIAIRQARLYQTAQQQVDELQRLNQLKDDFLSTISHELRSPIANIKMIVRLLTAVIYEESGLTNSSQFEVQDDRVVQYLQILQNECERELILIQDLLDLQHLNAGVYPLKQSQVDLEYWVSSIAESFKLITQSQQQTLEIYLAPDLPVLVTDSDCLTRIMTELLNNACKYTPQEGTIAVLATTAKQYAELRRLQEESSHNPDRPFPISCFLPPVPATVSDSNLVLSVINTGINLPVEECDRIFDKFYRVPSNDPWKHGGTGLGLALVKRITEYLSGSIYVVSTTGQLCFMVELAFEATSLADSSLGSRFNSSCESPR